MKYLIVTLALILAGCTESDNSSQLRSELRESQMNLSSCQNSLEVYRGGSNSGGTMQPETTQEQEPEQPAEPQCQEVEYSTVYKDGKLLATCKDLETQACGLTASSCLDGYQYNCLTNVKLGSDTKKECN